MKGVDPFFHQPPRLTDAGGRDCWLVDGAVLPRFPIDVLDIPAALEPRWPASGIKPGAAPDRESIFPAILAVLLFCLATYWLVLVPSTSPTSAFPESSTEGYDGMAVLGQHESELASPPPGDRYQAIAKLGQMTGLDQGDTDHAFART